MTEPQNRGFPAAPEPSIPDILGLLWHRRALIYSTVAISMLVTTLIVFQLAPRYTAETQIFIGTRTSNVVEIENVIDALRPDRTTLQSEVQVLKSRGLAEKVVGQLGLEDNPEFNRNLRPSVWSASLDKLGSWLRGAFAGSAPTAEAFPEQADLIRSDTVTELLEALDVGVVGVSRVVSVAATSTNPVLAAAIANTLSEIYLAEQLQDKLGVTEQAAAWLDKRVQALREQVEESDRAVEDYRQAQGLTQASNTTLIEQQISEFNIQLIAAQATRTEADAKLRQAREQLRSDGDIYAVPEVLAAPLIQNLRLQEATLAGQVAQLASEYGPRHPQMVNVTAELSDIRAKIAIEVDRIVRGLENDLEVAQTRERTLAQRLESLKEEASRLTTAQARLRVLEREAAANQGLFDVFLARWKETGQQEDLFSADARIISRAAVPSEPAWPNVAAAMSITLVASILLALLLVFLVEQLFNRGFRDSEQIETAMNSGVLGVVPKLKEGDGKLVDEVLDEPMSEFAESLRMLHTGLLLADADESSCTSVLITSSVAEEGKTFIAIALTRLIARSGRKVLLIDGDLRHGQVGKRLGLSDKQGLAQLLTGQLKSAEQAIQRDESSGLDVLTAGRVGHVPTDILRSRSLSKLLQPLRDSYEMIVVDSPPSLLVSDSRTLARQVDRTVYVVRWAETARKVALAGFKQILDSEAQVAGVVLSMAHTGKGARYPYGVYPLGSYSKFGRYYARAR
ncbi:GumC family protein [Candidatus Foliamicus sp.]